MNVDDHRYMSRAVRLAAKGLYTTDPNPRVGCVIVKNGQIVGEGWHQWAGKPHAEIHALQQAGDNAEGSTVYVSLEPCSHHGKTPPCADALIKAKVARVVAAMQDPNPLVAGEGMRKLADAGIQVQNGVLQPQAEALNPGFIKRMRHKRPLVRCKLAMSVDGRTALANGESQWITGAEARRDVHHMRARSSAILTGINTVLADDPSLNVRLESPAEFSGNQSVDVLQPLRVVVDSQLRTPLEAKMLSLPGTTLIATVNNDEQKITQLQKRGAEVIVMDHRDGRVDLNLMLQHLADRQINEIMVEAGPVLNGALLQQQLVDEVIIYMAPCLLGDSARGLFALPGLQKMADRVELTINDVRAVGNDWRISAHVKKNSR
jgi:diaminohydroxyphosphoribosylaminopyrimidine deaminase/5-amino-6-(5-phosphoribosylamino)uracil reductase